MQTLFTGAVGSTAYGYSTPESDLDLMSVHVNSLEYYFTTKNDDVVSSFNKVEGNDVTRYEFLNFVKMCEASNPNVLPLLFLSEYTEMSGLGRDFLNYSSEFLTDQTVPRFTKMARAMFNQVKDQYQYDQSFNRKKATLALRQQLLALDLAAQRSTNFELNLTSVSEECKFVRFSDESFTFNDFQTLFESFEVDTNYFYQTSPLQEKKLNREAVSELCMDVMCWAHRKAMKTETYV
jgi:predicted nucleotidyltransferase